MDALIYRQTGVDIEAGEEAARRIAPMARTTFGREVIGGIGGFAGFVALPPGYREPVLVSSTDGVQQAQGRLHDGPARHGRHRPRRHGRQ